MYLKSLVKLETSLISTSECHTAPLILQHALHVKAKSLLCGVSSKTIYTVHHFLIDVRQLGNTLLRKIRKQQTHTHKKYSTVLLFTI